MKKNLRLIWFCLSAALLFPGCGAGTPTEIRTSADVVKVAGSAVDLSSGGSAELAIPISIEPGYHVNANPATFDYLIATELTFDQSDGITFGKPSYPAAEKKKFQFAEQSLAVYERDVQIKLPLRAAPDVAKGKRSLTMHLRVQACDEEKCFPPDTLRTNIAVNVK